MVTGEPFSKQAKDSKAVESPYDGKMLVLSFRDRETLYGRYNRAWSRCLQTAY